MNIALDGQGTKHAQLTRALRAGITAGLYEQGERLPASRDFALQLGLSRIPCARLSRNCRTRV